MKTRQRREGGMKLVRHSSMLLIAGIIAGFAAWAIGGVSAEPVEDRRAEKKAELPWFQLDEEGLVSYGKATRMFEEAFPGLLFSMEYLPPRADGTYVEPALDFTILRNQKLEHALNTYCEKLGGKMGWRAVTNTMVAVHPVPERTGLPMSPMDARISLKIDRVSLRAAFQAFERTVNELEGGRILVKTDCEEHYLARPPSAFDQGRITLAVQNRPAREVLWAIIEQAPVPMKYNYLTSRRGPDRVHLSLRDAETLNRMCGERYEDPPRP